MTRFKPFAFAAGLFLVLTGSVLRAQDLSQPIVETAADGLDYPWNITTDGTHLIIAEKAGHVVIHEGGELMRGQVETSEPIETDGGRGLLGMALAPDYADTGVVYFFHSTQTGNRVIAARQDGADWREIGVILDGIPGHRLYNGGRIAFGPDGKLYITTGWTEDPDRPQDMDSLAGKILRINADGSIPADNPFPGSPIWTLGHRNPQGIAWDGAGRMFAAEHGQSAHDEVNLILPGQNYGWALAQGGDDVPGMTQAFAHSGNQTLAPSGIAVDGDRIVVAALGSQGLIVMSAEDGAILKTVPLGQRIRDLVVLDGALYAITSNRSPRGSGPSEDRLLRVEY